MTDPFNWHFPQRNETMFMATVESSINNRNSFRESSFQRNDIPGAHCKQQIPQAVHRENFAHSAYIEPKPESHLTVKNNFIETNNLRTRDIEYAYPQCNDFKTNRVINPLMPKYKLPYVPPVDPEPPRKYLRNTLDISDIVKKHEKKIYQKEDQPIEGSIPSKLFRTVDAKSRLEVKDINLDGSFRTSRMDNPTNPLQPTYTWRANRRSEVLTNYGDIGNHPKEVIPSKVNRRSDFSLNIADIQGAKANSSNE